MCSFRSLPVLSLAEATQLNNSIFFKPIVDKSTSESAAIEAMLHQAINIIIWMGVVMVIIIILQALKKAVVDIS